MSKDFSPRVKAVLDRNGLTDFPKWMPDCSICASIDQARREDAEDQSNAALKARLHDARLERWPSYTHDTDLGLLEASCVDKATAWRPESGKGLILHGESGSGKTRVMWKILGEKVDAGLVAYDSFDFGSLSSAAFRNGTERQWVAELVKAPFLFIDDLGKCKITARVSDVLFTVIDRRSWRKLPIFITTNDVGERLSERFEDGNVATPMLRRLRETCVAVHFKKKSS